MIGNLVERASSFADDIDFLILLIGVTVGVWFFLVQAVFFWLLYKFSASRQPRAKYITGDGKDDKKLISLAHMLVLVCDVVILVAAVRVWYEVKQDLPEADSVVRITGQQWTWSFRHPGIDGKLDTPDDILTTDVLHLEVDKTYHFQLDSRDVLHSFSVPAFRLKQDAVPGRTITGWFATTTTGEFDLQCAEMCGIGHGVMAARVVIEDAEGHAKWQTEHTPAAAATAAAPVVAQTH